MARRRQIYEGKAKILYEGPEPGTLIQYFKDDATAFNAQKKGTINGKGVLNNRISEHVFTLLGNIGVPTHFIRRLNMREQLIRQVEIVPIEVVVRNVVAGSPRQALGIEEGTPLPRTIVEYYFKDDALGDPMVTDEHILCFGWASAGRAARHGRHGDPRERLPVGPVRGHRHPPGRLQARIRPDLGQ
jgi:phosphoribosylaminoimidazole-succinocarboxamide synthase